MKIPAAAGVLLLSPGCVPEPIAWEPPGYAAAPPVAVASATGDARLCAVAETAHGSMRFRAGWSRASGELFVSKSDDEGSTWGEAVVADRRERGAVACDRPAPALFVDSSNFFLHVAYYARAPGGPGVYYVHSMNAPRLAQVGEGMFEEPFAIMFGTRAARTSVASRGDMVIVAFEDPNSPRGGVQVALSTTAGHSFDRRMVATRSAAMEPVVELRTAEVLLWWREGAEPGRWLRQRGRLQ